MESVIKWNRLEEEKPENSEHVLIIIVTSIIDNALFSSTAEAVYFNGVFLDPVEEWAKYHDVIAWAPMPEVKEEWLKDLL